MDVRDIKEAIPEHRGRAWEMMVKLQNELLDHYVKIEPLPPYPLEINLKKSQDLLKDFSARVVEELGESYESYELMLNQFHEGFEGKDMMPNLYNMNEEISDAFAFLINLLIYAGVDLDYIKSYYKTEEFSGGVLKYMMRKSEVRLKCSSDFTRKHPSYTVVKDKDLKDPFIRGGREVSNKHAYLIAYLMWRVTYKLQVSRNFLKNKPWKQSQLLTDSQRYKDTLVEALEALFGLCWFLGMDESAIFTLYFKKNRVNYFRIRSKY